MADDRRDGFVIMNDGDYLRGAHAGDLRWSSDPVDAVVFGDERAAETCLGVGVDGIVVPLNEAMAKRPKSLGEVCHDALSIAGPHWGDHEQQWRDRCERAAMAVVAEHERRRR